MDEKSAVDWSFLGSLACTIVFGIGMAVLIVYTLDKSVEFSEKNCSLPYVDPIPTEEPVKKTEAPKEEAPNAEAPKEEATKEEAPKAEAPKEEAPKAEAPTEATPPNP